MTQFPCATGGLDLHYTCLHHASLSLFHPQINDGIACQIPREAVAACIYYTPLHRTSVGWWPGTCMDHSQPRQAEDSDAVGVFWRRRPHLIITHHPPFLIALLRLLSHRQGPQGLVLMFDGRLVKDT